MQAGRAVMNKFLTTLANCVSAELMTKCALPRAAWAEKIFRPEVVGCEGAYANVSWNTFGMISVNLIIGGDVAFLGIPTDKVPGATYKDKRTALMRSTVDDLAALRDQGGFFARFVDGSSDGASILVIPSGFTVVMTCKAVRMLRWPIVADETDTARVKHITHNLMACFPEFRAFDSEYVNLAELWGMRI